MDENLFAECGWQLLKLGVRFYDPEIGRFGQRDPIKDGMNWYAYVRNRPTILIDPEGLLPGRYRSLCGEVCNKNSKKYNKINCVLCKLVINLLCWRAPDHCCLADKVACFDDCATRFEPDSREYFACLEWCEGHYQACLADGKPFELPPPKKPAKKEPPEKQSPPTVLTPCY